MKGWVLLHRELMDKAIWQTSTPIQKTILITLLMMANHKENEWEWKSEKFKVQPGQFITSLAAISEKCGKGVTIQNVRTALKRFEKYEFLTDESTNKNRLITISNWGRYQFTKEKTNKPMNMQLTSSQQGSNKQLTPNKNEKNLKNEKDDEDAGLMPFIELLIQNKIVDQDGITLTLKEDLINVMNTFGFYDPPTMINEAIKEATRSGGRTWKYVFNKLCSWQSKGIKRLGDLESLEYSYERSIPFKQKQIRSSDKAYAILDKF